MTQFQLLQTLFFGSLATFALVATWRAESKHMVGLVLFWCWVASNVIFWVLPFNYRPATFPILDVVFVLACWGARKETKSWVPIPLIILSILAVAVNGAISFSGAQTFDQRHRYEVYLNIIFSAQCLITGTWGAEGAVCRLARFLAVALHLRRDPQPVHPSRKND